MSAGFACFRFDPRHRQASIVHPLSAETLAILPRQDERPTSGGLMLHPASPFSPELASYVAWLARYHLLLRFEPLEIDRCVEESVESEGAEDDSDADSGFSVQLDILAFQIDLRQKDLWLDAGRAGFVLLDGMLYSSFYLDVEELRF
ncbi:hypothetical protein [Haliea atlantica]|jgi:hypothetical protein